MLEGYKVDKKRIENFRRNVMNNSFNFVMNEFKLRDALVKR